MGVGAGAGLFRMAKKSDKTAYSLNLPEQEIGVDKANAQSAS